MKKGQVAIVSAVMIVVLVILAILLSGFLFYDRTEISVETTEESGVFYMKFLDKVVNHNGQYAEGDCCRKYTYTNYEVYEEPEEVIFVDNFYHAPTCNSCNVPTTYTTYHKEVVPEKTVYIDSTFHVPACGDCNVKTYTRHDSASVSAEVIVMDNVHHVSSCCC